MTDTLQKTFKDSYTKQLIDGVKSGRILPNYASDTFEIDETQIRSIAGVYTPLGLQNKLFMASRKDGKLHGAEVAITLFEAYKNITPLIASDESFWAYLCHTELRNFAMHEWPWDKTKHKANYALAHYFFGKNYSRNALASLWWGVYLSYDYDREAKGEDPYTLTRVFFKNYSLRTTWLTVILRIPNALHGILEYLHIHPEIIENNVETRGLFISKREFGISNTALF
ncbi:MAG: DUF6339 family protein [Bacteroidales bacterium]|nr:DUF6339 family protein [Bacteroidales bacterium]